MTGKIQKRGIHTHVSAETQVDGRGPGWRSLAKRNSSGQSSGGAVCSLKNGETAGRNC